MSVASAPTPAIARSVATRTWTTRRESTRARRSAVCTEPFADGCRGSAAADDGVRIGCSLSGSSEESRGEKLAWSGAPWRTPLALILGTSVTV